MPGLKLKSLFGGKKSEEHQRLIDSDEDDSASSQPSLQSGSDDIAPPLLRQQVGALKQGGRAARSGGDALHSRRRDEALSGMADVGKEAVLMGADALAPGLGSGLGAVSTVHGLVQEHRDGGAMAPAIGKEVVRTGLSLVPVVGEFVGMAEGLAKTIYALGQPDKSRTASKVDAARSLCDKATAQLAKIEGLREQLASYDGDDKAVLVGRVDKAEERLQGGIERAREWFAKKSDHATAPLVASAAFEDDFGPIFDS